MTQFELAMADLIRQGVSPTAAREMLSAPGSPFGPGVADSVASPAAEHSTVVASPPPPEQPRMPSPVKCATHVAGNCPAGCPDRIRDSAAPVHVGYAIELHKYQVAIAKAKERFQWACDAMSVTLEGAAK